MFLLLFFIGKVCPNLSVLTGTHEDVPFPGEGSTEHLVTEGGHLEREGGSRDCFVVGGDDGDG